MDLPGDTLTIAESLSRDRTGNGYAKTRKETKTGSIRHLGLSPELKAILEAQKPPVANSDALVFLSPGGKPIDPGNFRSRYWKPVLEASGVLYRCPYTTRATVISHAIAQGTSIAGVAYIAGHRDTSMIVRHYLGLVDRPSLPQMPI
jgi:integrase